MAKRIQDQKEEERVVSKSRPAAMNLSSFTATSSSTTSSPVASKSPGMPIASGKSDSRMSIEPDSFDAASTSQVRQKDVYLGGLKEKQRRNQSHQGEEDSEDSDNPEAETWYCKGELVAQNSGASSSNHKESQKNTEATWDIISKYRRTHPIKWKPSSPWFECEFGFLSLFEQRAVHLGKDYDMNLRIVKNYLWTTTGQLQWETEKLIRGQTETTGISLINFQDLRWVSTS